MRDLPSDIDADVVIEVSRLLDAEDLSPLPVHDWLNGFVRYCIPAFPITPSKSWSSRWRRNVGCPWSSTSLQHSQFFHITWKYRQKHAANCHRPRMTGQNGRSRKRPWISFPPAGLATLNVGLIALIMVVISPGEVATRYCKILAARSHKQRRASSPQFTRFSRETKRPDQAPLQFEPKPGHFWNIRVLSLIKEK
ncbi:hypothetical protein NKH48_19395 [Mesorhizobium sp. M1233]|uniref:hypothetical protein n=1 Tax=Mesorhizobium sp. M1233 TaxID=2957072 RepID=UPI003334D76C